MQKLLAELQIEEQPEFAEVLRAAWHKQTAIGDQQGLVTRSSLLYGALAMSGVVREVLRAHGFERRIYEAGLGLRPERLRLRNPEGPVDFNVHERLRESIGWYMERFRGRNFDAPALALTVLRVVDGPISADYSREIRIKQKRALVSLCIL